MSKIILSNEQILATAPSVFATQPWDGVSKRYAFIPTIDVVEALRKNGFMPVRASQSMTVKSGRKQFAKHMLRFRHKSDLGVKDGSKDLVEIVLTNAHDLSAAYSLDAGIYRLICSNGMVVKSSSFGSINIRHSGDIVSDVVSGTKWIVERAPLIREQITRWRAVSMKPQDRAVLAEAALISRYGVSDKNILLSPITPDSLLIPRRDVDKAADLWTTANVIQENLMRGQIEGRSATGRKISTRAITSVNTELAVNRSVWSCAEVMADRLALK